MATTVICKDLYMATSMQELNKKVNSANIDCSTLQVLVDSQPLFLVYLPPSLHTTSTSYPFFSRLSRSSNALFLAAEDAAFQKDEEKAYVLFMRFMELVKKIHSSKECRSQKVHIHVLQMNRYPEMRTPCCPKCYVCVEGTKLDTCISE